MAFNQPGRRGLHDCDSGMPIHPVREHGLSIAEGHPGARTNPPKLDPELFGEQRPERQPQRGALGIAAVVVPNSGTQRLLADPAVPARLLRRDADVEQRVAAEAAAPVGRNAGRDLVKYKA